MKTTFLPTMSSGGDPPHVGVTILQEFAGTFSPPPSGTHQPPSCSIDESYKYIFLPICYSFTFIFSISLNSVILYRSVCRTKRWNASLIYMVNLATTDFMYGLSLPFLVASYIMRDCWVFGDFMCRLVRFLFYFNLYCSIFFLTCISVHRYLGICHPMRVITLETKKAVKCTCVVVWIVVFALTCPIFRFAQTGYVSRITQINDSSRSLDNQSHEALMPSSYRIPRGKRCDRTDRRGRKGNNDGLAPLRRDEGTSIFLGAHSPYASRRRKSIKTIITITLLFALCFFPFHVTRTIFLLLKVAKGVPCHTMTTVSMCYKITRPLASFNAWLNALLYFLTKDKGGTQCCPPVNTNVQQHHGLLLPLKMMGKVEDVERGRIYIAE
ncbi:P2Y purinoceptor 3 isoform X2 [Takifugu rubripes]|uniref:Si:dkey-6n21.13 n=1 Tax=Takifugu rubripes TaxID=31033 RepID=A0A3B5K7F1_TAKRU|nr:P2Y purinoceptor 3-like isoform X2 [Takifugu rubripes]XP_056884143.1 P2Y purinoceptor 3 isoform X2 [Takifugu flavidus]